MKISRNISIFLISAVLVFGTTISMGIPASFAQSYEDSYAKDKKSSGLNLQKVKCNNINNIIINGADNAGQGTAGGMLGEMADEDDGTWEKDEWIGQGEKELNDINKNIVNICINNNNMVAAEAVEENGLNVGSLYIVEGPVVPNAFPNGAESIASCDTGDFVMNGGFNVINQGLSFSNFAFVKSIPTDTLDGWSASFSTDRIDQILKIQATAVCFDAQ